MAIVFKTWINSVITYGMLVWGSCGQVLFSNLESIYVQAAKIIFNLIRLVYAGQGGSYHSTLVRDYVWETIISFSASGLLSSFTMSYDLSFWKVCK